MIPFYRQLIGGVAIDFRDLDLSHPRVRRSFRVAVAATLACLTALILQAEQPYWAGISAFVVMNRTAGATLYKSILRVGGTVLGAILGLILASFLVEHHVVFVLVVTLVAFCGIYLSSVFRRHVYAWILLYVTALMVMIGGLDNPIPETFVQLAFYRSFEIIIGILVSTLVSKLLFVEYANRQISDSLETANTELQALSLRFFDQLGSPTGTNSTEAFNQQARRLMDRLVEIDDLLDLASLESRQYSKLVMEQKMALGLRRMAEIMLYCYWENATKLGEESGSEDSHQIVKEIEGCLLGILQLSRQNLTRADPAPRPDTDIARLDHLTRNFESITPKDHDDRVHHIQIVQCLRLLEQELAHSFFPAPTDDDGPAQEKIEVRQFISGFYLDPYNVRFAISGAIAVLTLPFIWLYLDLPGYSQIVISIAACMTLTIGSTRFKGFLRLSGCLVGTLIVFLVLGLDIENLVVLLGCLFVIAFCCGIVFFGEPKFSYFGLQCFLVVVIGLVGDLSPVQSLGPPFERLLGIFLGINCLMFFQKLLTPSDPVSQLQHLMRQCDSATKELVEWVFRNPGTLARLDHWQNRRLFLHLASAIREVESFKEEDRDDLLKIKEEAVTNYRNLLHSIYGYILALSDDLAGEAVSNDRLETLIKQIQMTLTHEGSISDDALRSRLAEMAAQSKRGVTDPSSGSDDGLTSEHMFITEISLIRLLKYLHQTQRIERNLQDFG